MVTTDSDKTPANVTKDDVKKMKDEYVKGATIDDLAEQYGYTSRQVNDAVVDEVPKPKPNPTQAELDARDTKKAK